MQMISLVVPLGLEKNLRVGNGLQEEGTCTNVLVGHSGSVRSIALDSRGKIAVSAGEDGTGRVWNLATGDCIQLLLGHTSLGEPQHSLF